MSGKEKPVVEESNTVMVENNVEKKDAQADASGSQRNYGSLITFGFVV